MGLGKRGGLRRRIKAAAVELESQFGLGSHFTAGLQVAQEGDIEVQIPQFMGLVDRTINKVQGAIAQRQIEQGKPGWGRLWVFGRCIRRFA